MKFILIFVYQMDMDNLDEPDLTNMLNNFLNPLLEMSS